jgi:DNA-directed RNA polymerase subunit alpha
MSVDTINERAATEFFTKARKAEDAGEIEKAVEHYDHALNENPDHDEACFRLARLYDQHGVDSQAIELYERVCGGNPVPLSALMNLAVLYEDNGMYQEARRCLQAVLATNPNHPRARLYLRDVDSAHDTRAEEAQRLQEQRDAVLEQPIGEFDLSVRARNALKKMQIETLGDLLRVREQELMAFKNFGETSLSEIKSLMATRGLRLGQLADEAGHASPAPEAFVSAPANDMTGVDSDTPGELMEKPIGELDLSVRSRKALQRLDIQTLGELANRTDEDLLACKNFGQTSLNEIKQILASYSLSLRKE